MTEAGKALVEEFLHQWHLKWPQYWADQLNIPRPLPPASPRIILPENPALRRKVDPELQADQQRIAKSKNAKHRSAWHAWYKEVTPILPQWPMQDFDPEMHDYQKISYMWYIQQQDDIFPVSYTHLTLTTKRIV